MRDVVAALAALLLLMVALQLRRTLRYYRRTRERSREAERALGRQIIAELPTDSDLTLFSEDDSRFYHGDQQIDKDVIRAVRVLVNGQPIASCVSRRIPGAADVQPTTFDDHPEGIARDRWDVAIEAESRTMMIECGAIRERISQELARKIYEAVKRDIERHDDRRF